MKYRIPFIIGLLVAVASCQQPTSSSQNGGVNDNTNGSMSTRNCNCVLPAVGGNIESRESTRTDEKVAANPGISISADFKKIVNAKIGSTGEYLSSKTVIRDVYREVLDSNPKLTGEINIYRDIACAYYIIVCEDENMIEASRANKLNQIIDEYKTTVYSVFGRGNLLDNDQGSTDYPSTPGTNQYNQGDREAIDNLYPTISRFGELEWTTTNLKLDVAGSMPYREEGELGKLYTLGGAMLACSKLGNGWRLPTDKDWENLFNLHFENHKIDVDMKKAVIGNIFQRIGQAVDLYKDFKKVSSETYKANVRKGYLKLIDGGKSGFNAQLGGTYNGETFLWKNEIGVYWVNTSGVLVQINSRDGSIGFVYPTKDTKMASCRCAKGNITTNDLE